MNCLLTKEDANKLIEFYRELDIYDENDIKHLIDNLNDTIIITSSMIDEKITSLIVVNIIKNNYYLEKLCYLNEEENEIKNLISYTVQELKHDERGLNIIYDNFPYQEYIHSIMLSIGFKCNFLNMMLENDKNVSVDIDDIIMNDKEEDVKEYLYRHYTSDIESNNMYLKEEINLPEIDDIRLENTNTAVIRNENNYVVGVVRFGIVSDFLYLDSLYGDDDIIIKKLIGLIKSKTTHNIEVGIYPTREHLIDLLISLGFKKYQADYIMKLG